MSHKQTEDWLGSVYQTFLEEAEAGNYEQARKIIESTVAQGYEGLATMMENQLQQTSVLTFAQQAMWVRFEQERKERLQHGLGRSKEIYWLRLARKTDEWSSSTRCLFCGEWWMWGVENNLDFICPKHN